MQGCVIVDVGMVVGQSQGIVTVESRRHSFTVHVEQIEWEVIVGQEACAAARLQ